MVRRIAWRDTAMVFVVALIGMQCYRIAWPPSPGRDFTTYVLYYVGFWQSAPSFPMVMLFRTPVVPLLIGGLTELGGAWLVSVALGLAYATAVSATYLIGAFWNRQTGWLSALALLAYPSYAAFFHEIASDAVFASLFLAWIAAVVWTSAAPTPRRYAWHAVAVCLLILTRPIGQCFLAFAFFPWIVPGVSHRLRAQCAASFAITAAVILLVWSAHNAVRYGDFTIARGGKSIVPFYRAFLVEKIVRPENGPASLALAEAVRNDVLNREPYISYHIDQQRLFASGSERVWSDLFALSDRRWGWKAAYAPLQAVGLEAVRAHPLAYVQGVAHDLGAMLTLIGYASAATAAPHAAVVEPSRASENVSPVPAMGDIIPQSSVWWLASTPDGHEPVLDEASNTRVLRISSLLTPKAGSVRVADGLNKAGRLFPPMILWLLVGALGTWGIPGFARRVLFAVLAMSGIALLATVLGESLVYQYRMPFDPLCLVFGVAGFVRRGLRADGRTL